MYPIMTDEQWIVVGTDFSDGSQEALERGLRLAHDSRSNLALVHADEDEVGSEVTAESTSPLLEQLVEEIAVSSAARRGIYVEPLVRRGPPWEVISTVAREYRADLVVVGATGQRGVTRGIPLGSVASRLLALSMCSVVVARAPAR